MRFLNDKDKNSLKWFGKKTLPINYIDLQIYEQLKPLRLPFILIIIIMMFGTIGYILIDNFSIMDALYQTGITFTTVGFGEIASISNAGRFFTIILIVLGFATFTFAIGVMMDMINKGTLVKLLKERSMLHKIVRLKNHYIICHQNSYTIELTKQFRENHIPFVVVDNSPDIEQIAKKNKYPYFIQGEPHTETSILKSCLSSAKGVITLSENIADNIAQIVTTRLYESELGIRRPYFILSHANNESEAERLKKLGANSVVSASKLVAQRLSAISLHPEMQSMIESFLSKKDANINIEEINIPDYSWLRFKKIKETRFRDITNVSIVGIKDMNDIFIPMPKGDVLIGSGSKLLVIGTNEGIINTKRLIRKKTKPEELKYV